MVSFLESIIYTWEQIFSHMKHTKSKIRRKILNEHLENILRIASVSNQILTNWYLKNWLNVLIKNYIIFFQPI